MNGKTTKYYKFKSSGSGRVNIPIALAEALNWGHNDEINILIQTFEGKTGLFLFKKKEKESTK